MNWDMKRINCWKSKTVNYRYKYLEPYEEEKKSRFTKEESEICDKAFQIYSYLNGEEKVYKFYKFIFNSGVKLHIICMEEQEFNVIII